MILFDTDTFTLHMFGHEKVLGRCQAAPEVPGITIITEIEVLRGRYEMVLKAENGEKLLRAQQALNHSRAALNVFTVTAFDTGAVEQFDRLRENKKVKKIGRADLLIACIALSHKATLITRNLKHFQLVPGLHVENWAD